MLKGVIDSNYVVVQILKWLYGSMLHPENIEASIVKLQNGLPCVTLVLKYMSTLTFISIKVGMSEELFERSLMKWPLENL
jgi:hypothetical protein